MKKVRRRGFLGGISGGFAGALTLKTLFRSKNVHAQTISKSKSLSFESINPRDVKLNVKFVAHGLVHSRQWQGPCRERSGSFEDQEKNAYIKSFPERAEEFGKLLNSKHVNYMKPELVMYGYAVAGEPLRFIESEFNKLVPDSEDVDLYIVTPNTLSQGLAIEIAKRFKKPVIMHYGKVSNGRGRDICAYLRSKGFESYIALDDRELNHVISLLRARKAFRQTRMLLVTDMQFPHYSNISSVSNFDGLAERYGIVTKIISIDEFSEEMENVIASSDETRKARQITDKLVSNARDVLMDKEYIINSVQFYLATKNLMGKHCCNAFSIECWEFCTTVLPEKWKIVPCLTHSLLKDEGYSSACQMDISELLSMRLLMSLSDKSAFMGNQELYLGSLPDGNVKVNHSVPSLKMNGYDSPDMPYTIQNFCAAGWGAKLQINFHDNEERTVTIARFNPQATKMIVASSEIVDCTEYNTPGCSLKVHLNLKDPRGFMRECGNFGHHVSLVYGDYTHDLKELGENMLGLEEVIIMS